MSNHTFSHPPAQLSRQALHHRLTYLATQVELLRGAILGKQSHDSPESLLQHERCWKPYHQQEAESSSQSQRTATQHIRHIQEQEHNTSIQNNNHHKYQQELESQTNEDRHLDDDEQVQCQQLLNKINDALAITSQPNQTNAQEELDASNLLSAVQAALQPPDRKIQKLLRPLPRPPSLPSFAYLNSQPVPELEQIDFASMRTYIPTELELSGMHEQADREADEQEDEHNNEPRRQTQYHQSIGTPFEPTGGTGFDPMRHEFRPEVTSVMHTTFRPEQRAYRQESLQKELPRAPYENKSYVDDIPRLEYESIADVSGAEEDEVCHC